MATAVGAVGDLLLSAVSCAVCCAAVGITSLVRLKLVNFVWANIHRYLSRSYLMQLQILE